MMWRGFAKVKAYLWVKIAKSLVSRTSAISGKIYTIFSLDLDHDHHPLVECHQLNLLLPRVREIQKPRQKTGRRFPQPPLASIHMAQHTRS
jgi:hypothetical protein